MAVRKQEQEQEQGQEQEEGQGRYPHVKRARDNFSETRHVGLPQLQPAAPAKRAVRRVRERKGGKSEGHTMQCPNQELNTRLDSSGAPFRSEGEYCSPENTSVTRRSHRRAARL
jgi:hypothetical protein